MVGCPLVAATKYYDIQIPVTPEALGYYLETLCTAGEAAQHGVYQPSSTSSAH